jgi:hypothetical protein
MQTDSRKSDRKVILQKIVKLTTTVLVSQIHMKIYSQKRKIILLKTNTTHRLELENKTTSLKLN